MVEATNSIFNPVFVRRNQLGNDVKERIINTYFQAGIWSIIKRNVKDLGKDRVRQSKEAKPTSCFNFTTLSFSKLVLLPSLRYLRLRNSVDMLELSQCFSTLKIF